MKSVNFTLAALTAVIFISCSQTKNENHVTESREQHQNLPGYYEQWLYIKTNGTNVLPDMRRYNWEAGSAKRSASNALLHVYEYGPSNIGGRIRALVIDKLNPNRILVGGASGGVFVSDNHGASWRAINDHAISPSVTFMDQNPLKPEVIYYCTGEASGNSADLQGAGVFKSVDGGNTFEQLPSTNNSNFRFCWSLKCSPKDTNTLFVATHNTGLWRSLDAGATFTKVHTVTAQINDLEILPDGAVLITVKGSGVYRSPNGNAGTFVKVASVNSSSSARTELAYCKNFPNVVYAAISGPDNGYNGVLKAFYKSSDSGKTFIPRTNPTGTINFGFTWYTLTMGVRDTDSNSVFLGSVDVGYSRNGGSSWTAGVEQHADNHVVVTAGNNMYLGSDGGLCYFNWSNLNNFTSLNNGLNITQFYAGAVSPHAIAVMGGTQDNGTKEGKNMNKAFGSVFGADGGWCFYHPNQSNVKYWSTQNGNVYRNGSRVSNNLPTSDAKWFIHPYHVSSGNGEILIYPSSNKLYYSNNGGSSYKNLGNILTGRLFTATCTPDNNPVVYSGGSSAFVAVDSAENASPVMIDLRPKMPNAIRASFLNCIKVIPGNRDKVYLAFSNVSDSGRLYMASDLFSANPVFKNIGAGLPKGLPVNYVECDPLNPEQVIFAGTDYGLYVTEDGGQTWVKDLRFPNTVVSSIQIHPNNKDVYFFTHGRGVFKGQINNSGVSSIDGHRAAEGLKIYPVPAGSYLNIESTGTEGVVYVIRDLSGKVVLRGSTRSVLERIDISALPAGNYTLSTGGSKPVSRKFNIVK